VAQDLLEAWPPSPLVDAPNDCVADPAPERARELGDAVDAERHLQHRLGAPSPRRHRVLDRGRGALADPRRGRVRRVTQQHDASTRLQRSSGSR